MSSHIYPLIRRLVPALLACVAVPAAMAESFGEWRYWQAQQGLADSYARAISRDSTGAVWVVHGDVLGMSRFDGRNFTVVKSSPMFQAFDSLDGRSGWIADHHGLHYMEDGKWSSFPEIPVFIPSYYYRLGVLDLGGGTALALLPDGIIRVTAASRHVERLPLPVANLGTLVTLQRAIDRRSMWVIGANGVAEFSYSPGGSAPYHWKEYPLGKLPVRNLQTAIAGLDSELFVSGVDTRTNHRVALQLSQGQWRIVADREQTGQQLLAWRDGIGDLWLADGDTLQRKPHDDSASGWNEVDQHNEVLAATVFQVIVNPDGSFFMATTRGLALYVNPAWTTFSRTTDSRGRTIRLHQHISSMLEDSKRRLWFLGQRSLFRFDGARWDEYPFPKGYVFDPNQPNQLGELPDGRILVQPQIPTDLTVFDPDSMKYSRIAAPPGYRSLMFWRRADGRFLVVMTAPGDSDALAILDGGQLGEPSPIHAKWNLTFSRGILETSKGELWLSGTTGLFRWANGKYEAIPWPKSAQSSARARSAYGFLEQPDGTLLIGGRDGLYRWTGKSIEPAAANIESARKLLRDRSGTVWAASGSGLFRNSRGAWIQNDVTDGLPSTVAHSMLEDSQGRIWVATNKGPALFRPGVDQDPPEATIPADQNLNKAASDSHFRIIFSGHDKWDITPAHRLLFSYRLNGGEWSPFAKKTMATFGHLHAGPQVFEVVALDTQGMASSVPARLAFVVSAAWYRTPGFLLLVSFAALLIAYLAWLAIHHYHERGRLIVELSGANLSAQTASRSKSEFLANMSHEIRTPMNGVLGMTELALETELPPDAREYLETVRSSGQALLTVINDILDFSKIEAGKMELDLIPFTLRNCLVDALRAVVIRAQEKGLELACDIDEDVPDALIGDPGRLRQIILNLVGNAIKFTESGEVIVSARLESRAEGRAGVRFSVRDTGIGIPEEKQRDVFESFSQADGSTTRRFGGTGLGLTICKRLARMMDGRIWLESEIDRGTTVHFTARFELPDASLVSIGAAPAGRRSLHVPPMRILLVEDNLVNQKVVRRVLEKAGHSVVIAADGHQALTAREAEPFDLILMDVQMPEMDGFEATREIRRREGGAAGIPIIALTAHAMSGDRERCLESGMDGYVTKPIQVNDLMDEIARLCLESQPALAGRLQDEIA